MSSTLQPGGMPQVGLYLMPAAVLFLAGGFLGCGMPHDAEHTYQRVRGGTIRAGISERPPWTRMTADGAQGIEAELLQQFGQQLEATIDWRPGSESELLELLHLGELDVVVAGLSDSTPWSNRVGLTRPYLETNDAATDKWQKHVWAVRTGENRWLLEIDEFLQQHRTAARRSYAEELNERTAP